MTSKCNKCGQSAPHLGDSWCLACSAVEALGGELRQAWGSAGSRGLATDILTTAVRQVRALRRLGASGAGESRAPRAEEAALSGKPARELPLPAVPPSEPLRSASVKAEEKGPEEENEAEDEDSESGESEAPALDPPVGSGLKAAPKPKADHREEIPRRRPPEREYREREADRGRASRDRSRDRRRHHYEQDHLSQRSHTDRRDHRWEEPHSGGDKKKKKNKNKRHRAGKNHQRLYRAEQDPFKRLHYKKPGDFWDRQPDAFW